MEKLPNNSRATDTGLDGLKEKRGTGEVAHQLRVLAALAEDLDLTPSTHMAAHNYL